MDGLARSTGAEVISGLSFILGLVLSSAEHSGGWLWLVNITGVALMLSVALTQKEEA